MEIIQVKNKNLMYVKERYDKDGNLRLELHCSGKDALTKKYKVYVKTFPVPTELKGKKDIEKYSLQCQLEWKEEVLRLSNGEKAVDNKILFSDYAERYVEDILKYKKDAYNHYASCLGNLKILKEKFALYELKDMTRPVIKNFCDWLCERTYLKESYIVKGNLRTAIKHKGLTLTATALGANVSITTLKVALGLGNSINNNSAKNICGFLGLQVEDYFKIEKIKVPYSKDANRNLKTLLKSILQDAVRNGFIEVNYATKEYTKPVIGTEKKKAIYGTTEEIKEFLKCLESESDIRKKVAFNIALELGLRGAELAGLEWKDVNFEDMTISINKNTMYIYGFGVVTKTTKNDSSTRVVSITPKLKQLLKDYQKWWKVEKENHGDL